MKRKKFLTLVIGENKKLMLPNLLFLQEDMQEKTSQHISYSTCCTEAYICW